jgi:uracil-DNA glycosylase family 4
MIDKPTTCSGCPLYEAPFGKTCGYVPRDGSGSNGVLVVLEAAGAEEEEAGRPTVGSAGQYLWTQLLRVGIERDGFMIHNVLSCRPPDNKLIRMPYTEEAIKHCSPNLDDTIRAAREAAEASGKTFVIVALGKFAFRSLMGLSESDPFLKEDYYTYPHRAESLGAWVIAAPHPSYLMQGKHNLVPTLQFAFKRALEIASDGLEIDNPTYLLDPSPIEASRWVDELDAYVRSAPKNSVYLSYDIETPYKKGKDESLVEDDEEDRSDTAIIRSSFSYAPGKAMSIKWLPEYMGIIRRLFSGSGYFGVGWNSQGFDDERISNYVPIEIPTVDAMLAWHTLNTSLPKGLGFVTPFYAKASAMWKHLSDPPKEMDKLQAVQQEAYYNAKDADMALRCWIGIQEDLKSNNLWHVFSRHVIELNKVLRFMSKKGVWMNQQARLAAETQLTQILKDLEGKIEASVPADLKKLKVYKKTPKSTEGLKQVEVLQATTVCPGCGSVGIKAAHFKSIGKKKLKANEPENPCLGLKALKVPMPTLCWAQELPFKLSNKSLQQYQQYQKHQPVIDRKKKTTTFDGKAMKTLVNKYPEDKLYPVISSFRAAQKLLGTYIGVLDPETDRVAGGMPVGPDGRIHTTYTHNPSTLRLASRNPNMQNLPRPSKNAADLANLVRGLIQAREGHTFLARDFSGIEAVLVGYEAKAPDYIRLARRDVHSFYTAWAIYELDKRISYNDLPQLSWDDDRLFKRLAEIKKEFGTERNNLYKHLVHAINFGQGPKGAGDKIYDDTGIRHDTKLVAHVMQVYKELFPQIPRWHHNVRLQAHNDGYLRNAFDYVHRFSHVYTKKLKNGIWERVLGDDAEAVLAFKPQSTAAGIMKECLLALFNEFWEEAGQWLRMTIHDEIFTEPPIELVERVDKVLTEVMERPIKQLPMPASWNMGPYLSILSESKQGQVWSTMK